MTSKPQNSPQGAWVRLAEADTADLFAIVRNLRLAGWEREVALKRLEEQLETARVENTELSLACDHHRMFWQKAEKRERELKKQLETSEREWKAENEELALELNQEHAKLYERQGQLETALRERNENMAGALRMSFSALDLEQRAEAAELEVERLREALREIANRTHPATYLGKREDGVEMYGGSDDASQFARAALGSESE